MCLEFSPVQERRLHDILDKGIEVLRDSFERSPAEDSGQGVHTEVTQLQSKLTRLEDMLAQRPVERSQATFRRLHGSSLSLERRTRAKRPAKCVKVRKKRSSSSKALLQQIEDSENEICALERTITSHSRKNSANLARQIDKAREQLEVQRRVTEKLKRDNEQLRGRLRGHDDVKGRISKLQQEYNDLALSFERSETVRRKQKALIEQLKAQLAPLKD